MLETFVMIVPLQEKVTVILCYSDTTNVCIKCPQNYKSLSALWFPVNAEKQLHCNISIQLTEC
jgi:hypothetical protein